METKVLQANLLELIRRTSTQLPGDVVRMIEKGYRKEKPDSTAKYALKVVLDNIGMARELSQPLCQDTGTIICYADLPPWLDEPTFTRAYERAVIQATRKGYLRQNSVDSITGRNSGNNLGPGSPVFHLRQVRGKALTVRMMLKGGGCENVGRQYSLPDNRLGAGRDLEGARLCLLDAVQQAQGKGCGPGILGVCIGGDRASGYVASKEVFFRTLDDTNEDKGLARLERRIVEEANELNIGPMGFGGATTLVGCKITHRNRLPASFFVSVSYMCWAFRRNGFKVSESGKVTRWLYDS
jgi:fumarate hydratase class I